MWPPYPSDRVAAGVAIYVLLATITIVIWTCIANVPSPPDYALESKLVFSLERGLAALAALTLPALFVGPLLAGRLPTAIGREGINWENDRADIVTSLQNEKARVDALERAVARLNDELDAL